MSTSFELVDSYSRAPEANATVGVLWGSSTGILFTCTRLVNYVNKNIADVFFSSVEQAGKYKTATRLVVQGGENPLKIAMLNMDLDRVKIQLAGLLHEIKFLRPTPTRLELLLTNPSYHTAIANTNWGGTFSEAVPDKILQDFLKEIALYLPTNVDILVSLYRDKQPGSDFKVIGEEEESPKTPLKIADLYSVEGGGAVCFQHEGQAPSRAPVLAMVSLLGLAALFAVAKVIKH